MYMLGLQGLTLLPSFTARHRAEPTASCVTTYDSTCAQSNLLYRTGANTVHGIVYVCHIYAGKLYVTYLHVPYTDVPVYGVQ